MDWNVIGTVLQLLFLAGILFWLFARMHRTRQTQPTARPKHNASQMQRIARMRCHQLNEPLSELTRPTTLSEIIGQEEGIKALRAALCGPNPQHVLLYGPPGVGKTCAARLILEEAKLRDDSPFDANAQFVEVDATCVRFDERAIADPLIGSVHDPIYQGAGALGTQGVPQPKPGAVTRAHCGILFLDEIGELHPMQMNKLLKVLEDRCVHFESAYYTPDNHSIPQHIHDIFQNGLPADFRLIGATTRRPDEISPAIRSRCVELFFNPLNQNALEHVARGAVQRAGYSISPDALQHCALHAHSGRDAVNIIQLCCGIAHDDARKNIIMQDVRWVVRTCRYTPRMELQMPKTPQIGTASALAVSTTGNGTILEIECSAYKTSCGSLTLNGIVEEEELKVQNKQLKRKSMARGSAENVLEAFKNCFDINCDNYSIRFNIPGGIPVDGPSAGIALAVALMSALNGQSAEPLMAFTGEVTIHGRVRPVGGVREKIQAAIAAGAHCVIIPQANWEQEYASMPIDVQPVSHISQVMNLAFNNNTINTQDNAIVLGPEPVIATPFSHD